MAEPLYQDGAWWVQGSDGAWLRWSDERHAWEPPPELPGPEFAMPESPTAAKLPPPRRSRFGPRPGPPGSWCVPLPALFLGWWSAFVVSTVIYGVAARAYDSGSSASALKDAAGAYLAADVLSLLAAAAAIVVVRRVTARQDARARALATTSV